MNGKSGNAVTIYSCDPGHCPSITGGVQQMQYRIHQSRYDGSDHTLVSIASIVRTHIEYVIVLSFRGLWMPTGATVMHQATHVWPSTGGQSVWTAVGELPGSGRHLLQ